MEHILHTLNDSNINNIDKMNIGIAIIIILVIASVLALAANDMKNSKLKRSTRSTSEKADCALEKKFASLINDLTKKSRDPKYVIDDMLEALDNYKKEKASQMNSLIVFLTQAECNIERNIKSLESSRASIKKGIILTDSDESAKQIEVIDASIDDAKKAREKVETQVIAINAKLATLNAKIEVKRTEVLTLISSYVTNPDNDEKNLTIDLSGLYIADTF